MLLAKKGREVKELRSRRRGRLSVHQALFSWNER
jgi:hypothetical protein